MTTYADRLIPKMRPDGSPIGRPLDDEKAQEIAREITATDLLGASILELYQVRSVLWGIQERLTGKSDGLKVDGTLGEPCQPSLMMGLAELRKEVSDLNDLARSIVKIL